VDDLGHHVGERIGRADVTADRSAVAAISLLELGRPGQGDPQFGVPGQADGPAEPQDGGFGGLAHPGHRGDRTLRDAGRIGQHRLGDPLLGRSQSWHSTAHTNQYRQRGLVHVKPSRPPSSPHDAYPLVTTPTLSRVTSAGADSGNVG
jgi:hypothetical protein